MSLKINAILQSAIAARAFPGASVHLSRGNEKFFVGATGTLGYETPWQQPVTLDTLYDLASVTKIYTLATTLLVCREAGLALETPLQRFFPAFDERITLELLLSHASGIEFPIQKLEKVGASDWLAKIAVAPLGSEPGSAVLYSCTNYFLLARVAEKVSGLSLDHLMEAKILRPLHLGATHFEPGIQNVAPTEQNETGFWCGVVHDEAARSWKEQTGTCAGNAGLFATAADVSRFASIWTKNGASLLHPDDVSRALHPLFPERTYWRGLGFQIDAAFYLSQNAPRGAAGHLGFTGPSLALHFESDSIAVILNNRVHPTRTGPDRLPWHRQIAAHFFGTLQPSS